MNDGTCALFIRTFVSGGIVSMSPMSPNLSPPRAEPVKRGLPSFSSLLSTVSTTEDNVVKGSHSELRLPVVWSRDFVSEETAVWLCVHRIGYVMKIFAHKMPKLSLTVTLLTLLTVLRIGKSYSSPFALFFIVCLVVCDAPKLNLHHTPGCLNSSASKSVSSLFGFHFCGQILKFLIQNHSVCISQLCS